MFVFQSIRSQFRAKIINDEDDEALEILKSQDSEVRT